MNHVNEVIQIAINKLEDSNVKIVIEKLSKELSLDNKDGIYKPYIRLCDQKKLADKFYRLYRQNHNSERIELLLSPIEIPKIKIKNNRQFI